jgi:hypothetical protein
MRPIPKELTDALRAEFLRLIEGDSFLSNLVMIEKLTQSTRQLVMTIGVVPQPPPGSLLQSFSDQQAYVNVPQAGPSVLYPGGNARNVEQFGARAVRELVALAPDIIAKVMKSARESPLSLVGAIHAAHEKGMTELATKLEAKLFGESTDEEGTTPPHEHANANGTAGAP